MPLEVINLKRKLKGLHEFWSPRVVAELNDYQLKLAKLKGDFIWHSHPETDEMFYVIKGRLSIELRDGSIELAEGEVCVVPRGVEHRPRASEECHVLLIEPRGVVNTGDAGGALQAENDVWL